MKENELGRAALHVHSTRSDGLIPPGDYPGLASKIGLDVLAITDHDRVEGALEALAEARRQGLTISVVSGIEVTTAQGHTLALFIEGEIPTMLSLKETVEEIHRQGGLAIAPHVGVGLPPGSIAPGTIRDLYERGERLDGIEVCNPCYTQRHVQTALNLSETYDISQIGADDDHFGNLGRCLTLFPGKTPADLRRSIETGKTVAIRDNLPPLDIPTERRIRQLVKGLTWDLSKKMARSPVLVSTLITLRLEELIRSLSRL